MKKVISSLLFAILVGAAAAFFRPMAPYQVVEVAPTQLLFVPRGGAASVFVDSGLDNPDIADDQNISPARKCGFCMGVSKEVHDLSTQDTAMGHGIGLTRCVFP